MLLSHTIESFQKQFKLNLKNTLLFEKLLFANLYNMYTTLISLIDVKSRLLTIIFQKIPPSMFISTSTFIDFATLAHPPRLF